MNSGKPKSGGVTRTSFDSLTIREVTHEAWPDFERLFESKGGPKYCWCMAWRATSVEIRNAKGPDRKHQIAERVNSATPVGILGYLGHEPVAWCSIAPRNTFRGLVDKGSSDNGVWSITCFYIPRRHRKAGLATRMLSMAIEHAKGKGAEVVEGYPVDFDSPSYRHMGFVSMFRKLGFSDHGLRGTRRHMMRLPVR